MGIAFTLLYDSAGWGKTKQFSVTIIIHGIGAKLRTKHVIQQKFANFT